MEEKTNICPYCGAEMEKGKLSGDGRTPIQYSIEKETLPIIDSIKENERHFIVAKPKFFGYAVKECFRCRMCRKIIIDYGENK